MSEIITLSSDEEDVQSPPKKKIKPTPVEEVSVIVRSTKNNISDIVILSDDETESNLEKGSTNGDTCQDQSVSKFCGVNIKENSYCITIPDDQSETLKNGFKTSANCNSLKDGEPNKENVGMMVDETSSAGSSGKENEYEKNLPENNEVSLPSTSSVLPEHDKLEKFLTVCGEGIANSQYQHLKDKQFPILRKYFRKCVGKLSESVNFVNMLEKNLTRAKKSPATAVISFNEVFQYIKQIVDAGSIEVPEEHRIKLKKLEKAIKLLVMRIKQLEGSELNFDDEEDSSYLQLDRYINRLNKVYRKYCELLKKNPYTGRITYEKLDFVDSEYNEINRAICKKYKNNEKFPSYYEMEQYIRKVVSDHKLDFSESMIKSESVKCFKKLGELLQKRRKKDLYDAHYLYIRDSEDPANSDKSLDSTLKQSFTEGQSKMEKVCEEFTLKEELGEEVVLSEEDCDKSDEEGSDNEEITDT